MPYVFRFYIVLYATRLANRNVCLWKPPVNGSFTNLLGAHMYEDMWMLPLLQKCVDVYCIIYVKGGELTDNWSVWPENVISEVVQLDQFSGEVFVIVNLATFYWHTASIKVTTKFRPWIIIYKWLG